MRNIRYLSIAIMVLGVIVFLLGGIFTVLALQKNDYVTSSLRAQKLTLGLSKEQVAQGKLVDNMESVMVASGVLDQHLKNIAPTYSDLMATNKGGKYDPTDPRNLTYAQGLNLITSLNVAALSFGVVQAILATGLALLIVGIAVGASGFALFKLIKP